MNRDKIEHIARHLQTMVKGHGLTLMIGSTEQLKEMEKEYSGMCVFITDGEKSFEKQKLLIGKSIEYPSKLTLTLNRFKPENHGSKI